MFHEDQIPPRRRHAVDITNGPWLHVIRSSERELVYTRELNLETYHVSILADPDDRSLYDGKLYCVVDVFEVKTGAFFRWWLGTSLLRVKEHRFGPGDTQLPDQLKSEADFFCEQLAKASATIRESRRREKWEREPRFEGLDRTDNT